MNSEKNKTTKSSARFYGYKHWTLEPVPRCFNVGRGRKGRSHSHSSRNHKWHAIVKQYGLRVEVCVGPITLNEASVWEATWVQNENTYTTNHAHDDPNDIGCNFTRDGDYVFKSTLTNPKPKRRKWTPEQRARVTGRKGHQQTLETRRKIGLASSKRKSTPQSRMKNRIASLRENLSLETQLRRSKSLSKRTLKLNLDGSLVETFESLKSAAARVGTNSPKLSCAIKYQKPCKGFMWKYDISSWHNWTARFPPKEEVAGSTPAEETNPHVV